MPYSNHQYKAWDTKARSWEYLENRFITGWGGDRSPMLQLVKHIKDTGLSNRIFGSTSMAKLIISNCDPIDFRKEALHITFDLEKKLWHFEYHEQPHQIPVFIRNYPEDTGLKKFDDFIKMICW
jgi:hypothetical protein